ncbi:O-antigen ligase family protein [Vibrio sinaloensis]|uniref:O-antigen ligase family protein n=1 Tax=Photobacterium sp. (strain ATCC 43367) TaxID=379097 RepID=UPI0035EE0911
MIIYKRTFKHFFFMFFILFGLVFNTMLGSIGALAFLVSGMLLLVKYVEIRIDWLSYYPILLIPTLAICSFLWSDYPSASLRGGVQLILTTLIAIYAAKFVPFSVFKNTLLLVLFFAMLASLLSSKVAVSGLTGEVNLVGIFGSKNFLAVHSSLSCILGFYLLFSKRNIFKILGATLFSVSCLVLFRANSVGSIGFMFLSLIISSIIIIYQNWKVSKKIKVVVDGIILTMSSLVLIGTVSLFLNGSLDEIIYGVGKDPTLTGRTVLWDIGYVLFLKQPLLGFGYEGLFRIGNYQAEDIWEMFSVASGSGFNFHNMYVDTMVEFGTIGIVAFMLQIALFIKAILKIRHFSFGTQYHFIVMVFTYLFLQTFLEAGWSNQFTLIHFLISCFWVYLKDIDEREYKQ